MSAAAGISESLHLDGCRVVGFSLRNCGGRVHVRVPSLTNNAGLWYLLSLCIVAIAWAATSAMPCDAAGGILLSSGSLFGPTVAGSSS